MRLYLILGLIKSKLSKLSTKGILRCILAGTICVNMINAEVICEREILVKLPNMVNAFIGRTAGRK